MDIHNKVIAITGGAQGLGLAMAKQLADKGARVALIDINKESLDKALAEINQNAPVAKAYVCNITDEASVEGVFDTILADFGQLHGLVNNAGITKDGLLIRTRDGESFEKMSLAQWQTVVDVNLTGVFLCGREAAEKMIKSKSEGVIINISSISRAGNFGQTNYSATKAGVAAMAVCWAKELARYNIRAAAIAPGFVATDMVMKMKPEALENMAANIPLKRLGASDEIAQAVVSIFENDYINGSVLEVNGGLRI